MRADEKNKSFFLFCFYDWVLTITNKTLSHQCRWMESNFKAKPKCRKLSFCLHNTLTYDCFIVTPRQDVISTLTAPHWIADEIMLLTKEMCSGFVFVSFHYSCLVSECLDGYFAFKLCPIISARSKRKDRKKNFQRKGLVNDWGMNT